MKVASDIRALYDERLILYRRLSDEINLNLKPKIESRTWFFLSRIKGLESFASKLETARVTCPRRIDDFFACTIVVPTLLDVEDAFQLVKTKFKIIEKRPKAGQKKLSSDFSFNDLRVYAEREQDNTGKNQDLTGLNFEIQIKTILQHAWSVATHDLIYKNEKMNWDLERVAYQVKAMLEHSELAIANADLLSLRVVTPEKEPRVERFNELHDVITGVWKPEKLPNDTKRLVENVLNLLYIAGIDAKKFGLVIQEEIVRAGGLSENLSPYAFSLQALLHTKLLNFENKLKQSRRSKVYLSRDIDVPSWIKNDTKNVVRIA